MSRVVCANVEGGKLRMRGTCRRGVLSLGFWVSGAEEERGGRAVDGGGAEGAVEGEPGGVSPKFPARGVRGHDRGAERQVIR